MLLNNRYQLEETLGQGGAGVVYRAFDVAAQRVVAVKALNGPQSRLDREHQRLRREATLLGRLTHPNIVDFYELVEAGDHPYLIIEYIAGCTLRDFLETQRGPLPITLSNHIINGVLSALQAAHQAGVIHRDLKPENIMLAGVEVGDTSLDLTALQPEVKVTDFGLAYLRGDVRLTMDNLVAGTALYLAPEAALGQEVDGRADLYAVGMILYELVAGHPPFRGDDPLVIISQHLHATPISPRWHNANVSSALARIILKLLAKTPAERYQTAEAVLADLETVQHTGKEIGALTKASLLDAIARGRWVGREAEIALIRNSIDDMVRGAGGAIFIEGDPGIGKSRLVGEANVYARLKGAQVFTGHCYDGDLALPYHPFIEIVKEFVQTNIEPVSTGHLPSGLAAELVKLAPGLEAHLGVAPAPADGPPAEARLRLFEAVVTLLTSGPNPILLILENLHRASPPDLALLSYLARTGTRNRRLLLLVTYRDDPRQQERVRALADLSTQLSRANLAIHLQLQPLSADDTTALLETFLEGEVSPDFSQAIFKVTEGNPFFIEETLTALIEEGRIYYDPDRNRWTGLNVERLQIPASLKEVINRRLEKLNRPHHQLLSLAALLGRQFRVDALLAAAEAEEDEVLDAVEAAVEMQLIRQVSPADENADTEMYVFEHSLFRRTLQAGLGAQRQRRLHHQIGHALERLNESRSQPVAPPDKLAYHFSQAGGEDIEKAISYSLIAVENALQVHATEVAAKHYLLILDLLPAEAIGRRAWTSEQLGDLYFYRTRQIVNALARYESAIQVWQTAPEPDRSALIRLYRNMGEIARYWQGHVEKLDTYLAAALRLLDEDPTQTESLERSRVLAAMAFNRHARSGGQPEEEALNLAQTAAKLAAQLDAADEESTALDAMQRVYRAQGNLTAAHAVDRRRLELIPHLTKPTEAIDAHLGASQMGWETGDLMAASNYCLEALAIAQRSDNIGGQWEALRRLVMLHLQWGKLSTATTYATQGVALGPRAGLLEFGEPVEAIFHTHLAILYTLQGQAEAAARELAELRALSPTPEAPPYRAALGWLHYETEAWAEARLNLERGQAFPPPFVPVYFERVLLFEIYGHLGDETALNEIKPEVATEIGYWELPYFQAILNRGYGAFYARQGDWPNAEAAFKSALAVTRGQTFWYQDARTWLDYGRMLARRNQADDAEVARDFLTEAQNMFTTFGAHALAEKAWIEVTRLGRRE